ncbi:MAG: ribonuclease HII [Patescibacteria group bacterium]
MKSLKPQFLIGIDEVGRGPIAGAVAVGAFCIPIKNLIKVRRIFRGVKESKQLSEQQREGWFGIIQQSQKVGLIDFAVTFQSEKIIDTKGLSYAIKRALAISLNTIAPKPDVIQVLLDGGLKAPAEFTNQKTIIKGDEKELVIALASICAKVLRDRKMNALAKKYTQYGFEKHKGYGTRAHYEAIKKYGQLPLHRTSFLKAKS